MSDTPAPDADAIAAAVASCPGVARLHGGVFGEAATYLPGRRVVGVQVGERRISVHIVARPGLLTAVADGVRGVVTPLAQGLPVDVVVEDIALDSDDGNDDEHTSGDQPGARLDG